MRSERDLGELERKLKREGTCLTNSERFISFLRFESSEFSLELGDLDLTDKFEKRIPNSLIRSFGFVFAVFNIVLHD